jgi:hypothetical protein
MRKFFTIIFTVFFGLAFALPGIKAHYCKGELIDSAVLILQDDAGCCLKSCSATASREHDTQKLKKENCCTDLTYAFSTDEYHFANVLPVQFFAAVISLFRINHSITYHIVSWREIPSPPNLLKVSLPFIQVFLI